MKIRSPDNDTCNKCWNYQNELGAVSHLENSSIRLQVQSKRNIISDFFQEHKEKIDDNSTYSSQNTHQDNNSNNKQVETYDSELLEETQLSPPFARTIKNIGSKFKETWTNILRCAS